MIASIIGGVAASLGWVVPSAAVVAALLLGVFRRVAPSWLAPVLIVALVAAFIGSTSAKNAEIAALKTRHATALADIAQKTARANELVLMAVEEQATKDRARLAAAQAQDRKHQKELSDALAENRRRAGDYARYWMRFTGAASQTDRDPANPSSAAGVGAPASAFVEVTGDARRTVSDLREELLADRQALKALAGWAELSACSD